MTLQQIRSADPNIDLSLYFMGYKPSVAQNVYIYVLGGPQYGTTTSAPTSTASASRTGTTAHPASTSAPTLQGAAAIPSKIIDHIDTITN